MEVELTGDGDCFFRAVALALIVRGVVPKPAPGVDGSRYVNAVRASLLWSLYMSGPHIPQKLVCCCSLESFKSTILGMNQ